MNKNYRRNLKSRKVVPPHSVKETAALLDLLFVTCKENNSQCARIMGVNRKTWLAWTKQTPENWYFPLILRHAIKYTLSTMIAQRRTTSRKFQQIILAALALIPDNTNLEEEIADMAYEARGAELHLRNLLSARGRWWSEIRLVAHSGGYSHKMLRIAAKAIGVVKAQEGFGSDKDSFWRLPNEDED